ncbi:MAG: transglutaminase domain-containing protein [Acidobacteria bacterium]|nr:MAG: transglutaminase domain-containing protein [Acidobacteriota bacterium]
MAVTALLCGPASGAARAVTVEKSVSHPANVRYFELTYRVSIDNLPIRFHTARIWIPIASSDVHQEVWLERVSGSVPWRITRDREYGDRMLYAEIRNPRVLRVQFKLKYIVSRREYSKGSYRELLRYNNDPVSPELIPKRCLEPDRLISIDGEMKILADQVTRGKQGPVEIAHAVYNYLFRTLRYDKSGTGWGRGDAFWACQAKRGNCTDFHSAFIGMMRAEKIPARFVIGFALPENISQGVIPGYHCWAEFYVGGVGWVPVDISEAWLDKKRYGYYFGTVDPNRVRMSVGRDITLVPRQAGPSVNYFVYPYVEVDGEPFHHVGEKFNFRNLPAGTQKVRPATEE